MKTTVYTKYGKPEVVKVIETEKPTPREDEICIRIKAATLSSEDTTFRKGQPFIARSATGWCNPKLPTLGSNLSGEVESVGKSVTKFLPGDRVVASSDAKFGAHAEYICLSQNSVVARAPQNQSSTEAVSIMAGSLTALPFLRDIANLSAEQHILIHGASGTVGSAALQLAKYLGAEVTAVCSGQNTEWVQSLGADHVIDYTQQDFTQNLDCYDVIFDTVGKSCFALSEKALKPNGIYMTTVLNWNIVFSQILSALFLSKKAKIIFTGLRKDVEKLADLKLINQLAEKNILKAVIDQRYALKDIVAAHAYVDTGHKKGNVILVP